MDRSYSDPAKTQNKVEDQEVSMSKPEDPTPRVTLASDETNRVKLGDETPQPTEAKPQGDGVRFALGELDDQGICDMFAACLGYYEEGRSRGRAHQSMAPETVKVFAEMCGVELKDD